MRWTEPKIGEERIVRKFLWWPMCLAGQNRWLEFVHVRQIYERAEDGEAFWRWVEFAGQTLPEEQPEVGDTRVVQKYLWWPVRLGREIRWLERASVRQVYERTVGGAECWRWVEFVDRPVLLSRRYARGEEEEPEAPWGEGPQRSLRRLPPEPLDESADFVQVVKTSSALNDGSTFELLVGMGARAIPTLLRMRDGDQASVDAILRQIEPESAVPALINGLHDVNAGVREFAADLLCRDYLKPHSSDATAALAKTARDENANVRQAALRCMVEIAEPSFVVPILADALADTDARVRMKAAHLLRRIGLAAREAVAPLQRVLDDEVEGVRVAATAALGAIVPGAQPPVAPSDAGS
jgi:hypothetical protein